MLQLTFTAGVGHFVRGRMRAGIGTLYASTKGWHMQGLVYTSRKQLRFCIFYFLKDKNVVVRTFVHFSIDQSLKFEIIFVQVYEKYWYPIPSSDWLSN